MQSDILSQINGFFTGKQRRKSETILDQDHHHDNNGHLGSSEKPELFTDRFRRKSEAVLGKSSPNKTENGGKSGGISFVKVGKLDFKLNLKRLSFAVDDTPPALPARHFSTDAEELLDLPPPIPERKCSLDFVVDEEFQCRFRFRPMSTVPLPEPFTDCKKTYPSKTPRKNAVQRPMSQPPPPPPPADSPSPTDNLTFQLRPQVTVTSPVEFYTQSDDDSTFPEPPLENEYAETPETEVTLRHRKNGTYGSNLSTSWVDQDLMSNRSEHSNGNKYDETTNEKFVFPPTTQPEPPPPPTRPLPPPPKPSVQKMSSGFGLSSFDSKNPLPPLPAINTKPAIKKLSISKDKLEADQNFLNDRTAVINPAAVAPKTPTSALTISLNKETNSKDSGSEPLPSSPPPPPLPTRPKLPSLPKPKFSKVENGGIKNGDMTSSNASDFVTTNANISAHHDSARKRELPQLPVKPSKRDELQSSVPHCDANSDFYPDEAPPPPPPPPPPHSNHIDTTDTSTSLTLPLPLPPRAPSPSLPPPPIFIQTNGISRDVSPSSSPPPPPPPLSPPHLTSPHKVKPTISTDRPNKNRPLPSLPVDPNVGKSTKSSNGWGGQDVFDPREEEGDIYDVMESTNM